MMSNELIYNTFKQCVNILGIKCVQWGLSVQNTLRKCVEMRVIDNFKFEVLSPYLFMP